MHLVQEMGEMGIIGAVLNGSKMWITNGNIAEVAVVWAKVDGEVNTYEGTYDIHLLILGHAITGLSAFR